MAKLPNTKHILFGTSTQSRTTSTRHVIKSIMQLICTPAKNKNMGCFLDDICIIPAVIVLFVGRKTRTQMTLIIVMAISSDIWLSSVLLASSMLTAWKSFENIFSMASVMITGRPWPCFLETLSAILNIMVHSSDPRECCMIRTPRVPISEFWYSKLGIGLIGLGWG